MKSIFLLNQKNTPIVKKMKFFFAHFFKKSFVSQARQEL